MGKRLQVYVFQPGSGLGDRIRMWFSGVWIVDSIDSSFSLW